MRPKKKCTVQKPAHQDMSYSRANNKNVDLVTQNLSV